MMFMKNVLIMACGCAIICVIVAYCTEPNAPVVDCLHNGGIVIESRGQQYCLPKEYMMPLGPTK